MAVALPAAAVLQAQARRAPVPHRRAAPRQVVRRALVDRQRAVLEAAVHRAEPVRAAADAAAA